MCTIYPKLMIMSVEEYGRWLIRYLSATFLSSETKGPHMAKLTSITRYTSHIQWTIQDHVVHSCAFCKTWYTFGMARFLLILGNA